MLAVTFRCTKGRFKIACLILTSCPKPKLDISCDKDKQ